MEKKNFTNKLLQKKWLLLLVAVLIIIVIIVAIVMTRGDKADKKTPETNATQTTADDNNDTSGAAVTDTSSAALSIEDAPEPTLNPTVANDVIEENDAAPVATEKEHQKIFNDCMEAQDYEGAKEVLDTFFATNAFSISGENTFANYVYFYEKQGLYEESAKYQIDFLEREIGLDNVVESNTRYQKLKETLQYVQIEDPRLATIEASVQRWHDIQTLLSENQIDTAIETLRGYIQNGLQDCVIAYNYLAKAYGAKPDFCKQAKTYYIYLLRLESRELNTLEVSYKAFFNENHYVLTNGGYLTEEENEAVKACTIDTIP